MKKVLVGIMMMVLMATMIIPAFGEPEKILEEEILVENIIEETKLYETVTVVEDGIEIKRTFKENGVIVDEYELDDCSYVITYGNTPYIHIQVTQHSRILGALSRGATWVGDKAVDGYNWVKGLFVHNDD